jgi:hypothetical protein
MLLATSSQPHTVNQTVEAYTHTAQAPGWLQLGKNVFYLFGSAASQCMEYHCSMEVQKTIYF